MGGLRSPTFALKLRPLLEEERLTNIKRAALEVQSLLLDFDDLDLSVELETATTPSRTPDQDETTVDIKYAGPNELVDGRLTLAIRRAKDGGLMYSAWSHDQGIIFAQRAGFNPAFIVMRVMQGNEPFKKFEQSLISAFLTSNVKAIDARGHDVVYGAKISPPCSIGYKYDKVRIDTDKALDNIHAYITTAGTVRITFDESFGDSHVFEGPTLEKALSKAQPVAQQIVDAYHTAQGAKIGARLARRT